LGNIPLSVYQNCKWCFNCGQRPGYMRLGVAFNPLWLYQLKAWFWVIQNPQYAVDATAGVS
jgi:hypothetical protein